MSQSLCFLLVVTLLTGLAGGCASLTNGKDVETERLLSAAGFQMRLADSDAKLAQLSAMHQRKVAPQDQNGRTMYMYADEKGCKCLYVGTQRAYDRYERLALAHEMSVRRLETSEDRQDAAMELGAWGPWGPWWY